MRYYTHTTGGNFHHNSGTVKFTNSGHGTHSVDVNGSELSYNLGIDKFNEAWDDFSIAGGDAFDVLGTLTLSDGDFNTGTLRAWGNVVVEAGFNGGTGILAFAGANLQTYSDGGGILPSGSPVSIDKSAGRVVCATNMYFNRAGQDLSITGGALDLAGHDLVVNDAFTVQAGGEFRIQGTESFSEPVLESGSTFTYTGSGAYTVDDSRSYHNLRTDGIGVYRIASDLSLGGNLLCNLGNTTLTAGNLQAERIEVSGSGLLKNTDSGNIYIGPGGVWNDGVIWLDGGGSGCGDADDILIRSSQAATRRSWAGNGIFYIVDSDVKDMTGTADISARSSNDTGNNGANWTFDPVCFTTRTWDGEGGDGNRSTASNWSGDALPTLGDDVVFDASFTGACNVDTEVLVGSLVVNGGTLQHKDNSTTETHKLILKVMGDFTLNAGATINANGLGYDNNAGPGCPASNGDGGAHGGMGGDSSRDGISGAGTYGSFKAPGNIGSGAQGSAAESGSGGGAVMIEVLGTTTLNGDITASGTGGTSRGSAGGSVYLRTGYLSGSGNLRADGAAGSGEGAGGGGRVALILTGNSADFSGHSGENSAYGGEATEAGEGGAAGTVYRQTRAQTAAGGELIIDNGNRTGAYLPTGVATRIPSGETWDSGEFSQLTLGNAGVLGIETGSSLDLRSMTVSADGDDHEEGILLRDGNLFTDVNFSFTDYFIRLESASGFSPAVSLDIGARARLLPHVSHSLATVNVKSGGSITHEDNDSAEVFKLNLSAATLTVESGGNIWTQGLGYDAGYGPGNPSSGGDGGAYGGLGGDDSGDGISGAVVYGNIYAPENFGSGAEGTASEAGSGGGALLLTVRGITTVNGSINGNGTSGSSRGSAGGSVYLRTGAISGSGQISADGGAGTGSGAGAGGRISVVLTQYGEDFSGFSGTFTAHGGGGTGSEGGGAGTVYKEAVAEGSQGGALVIDNNDSSASASTGVVTCISSQMSGNRFGDVEIRRGATLRVNEAGLMLTCSGNWVNSASGDFSGG
ncbi:MAG: hypothetical protein HQL31_08805, partial [Planctomycetes bacterium]|nr:hypothetical protein [Planctomycetota bacterium]